MGDQSEARRGRKPTLYPYKGQRLSLAELHRISGWSIKTLRQRISDGMTAEQAVDPEQYRQDNPPPDKPEPLLVSYKGEERTLEEWVGLDWMKRRKITKGKLYARLFQLGWTKEEAFGDAPRTRPGTKTITIETPDGPVTKTMTEWADHTGIPLPTISIRRSRGWSDAQALEFAPSPSELRDAEQASNDDQDDSLDSKR